MLKNVGQISPLHCMDWHPVISVQQQTPDNDFCHFSISSVRFAFWAFFSKTGKTPVSHRIRMMTRWPCDPDVKDDPLTQWPNNPVPCLATVVIGRLRSASTEQLDVPTCRRSTIGGRAFPVAGAKVWNGLPSEVTSASSLSVFKNRLKTYLFRRCYETVWLSITFPFPNHYLLPRTVVLAIVFTV